jgi:hypothetical protein
MGVELKDSYYKQAILNLKEAKRRFLHTKQKSIFDGPDIDSEVGCLRD